MHLAHLLVEEDLLQEVGPKKTTRMINLDEEVHQGSEVVSLQKG